ncbi:Nicotinate-nucleotide pyrophosphorylase [carboxylating] chloroplastic, partial [Zea mays]
MIFNQVAPSLKVEWFESDGNYVHKGLQFGIKCIFPGNVVGVNMPASSAPTTATLAPEDTGKMTKIAAAIMSLLTMHIATNLSLSNLCYCSVQAISDAARPACILETRKTAPGLRRIDKWAVLIGGGKNHRLGLFDMAMIKDNHISVAGGIANAMRSVDQFLQKEKLNSCRGRYFFTDAHVDKDKPMCLGIDISVVETRTIEEMEDLLKYAAENKTSLTRIMLDNMVVPLANGDVDVSMLKDAVQLINDRFETEASGNVTVDTVKKIGESGVTYISSGALTHSLKALDISLKIDTELALQ